MERIRKILEKLPQWLLTVICMGAILWLTLAAKPLGDNELPMFPGADKVAHALMFGGFTFCILLDWTRKRGWRPIPWKTAIMGVIASVVVGIATEMAQEAMGIGRSGDKWDIVADTTGAVIIALIATLFGKKGDRPSEKGAIHTKKD